MNGRAGQAGRWLAVCLWMVLALGGLVAVMAAVVPGGLLASWAARLGHQDDLTADRLRRLRLVGAGLAGAHALLLAVVSAWGWSALQRWLGRLSGETGRAWQRLRERGWGRSLSFRQRRPHVVAGLLLAVLAAGAAVRLRYVNCPVDYDEAYSFSNFARRPLYQALADYHSTNNHLLNTLLMHVEYRLFGQRDWALRLHVLVAGLCLIVSVYGLGARSAASGVGLVAAAAVATSVVLISFSVNARGYVWVAWMSVILADRSLRLACRDRSMDWLIAGVAAVLGLLAMPIMVYAIIGAGALWVWAAQTGIERPPAATLARRGGCWAIAVALPTAWLYAPALVFRGLAAWRHRFVSPLPWADWLVRFPRAWWYALVSWSEGPLPWWLMTTLAAVGVVVCWVRFRRLLALTAALAGATAACMAVQRVAPPPRVLSFLSPFFLLLAGAGLLAVLEQVGQLVRLRAGQTAAAGLLCLGAVVRAVPEPLPGGPCPTYLVADVADRPGEPDNRIRGRSGDQLWRLSIRRVADTLAGEVRPDDQLLVALPIDVPLDYYLAQRGRPAAINPAVVGRRRRLWLVVRPGVIPAAALRRNLSLRGYPKWLAGQNWQLWRQWEQVAVWRCPASSDRR